MTVCVCVFFFFNLIRQTFPCLRQTQPEVVSESNKGVCLSAGLEAVVSGPQILVYRNPRSQDPCFSDLRIVWLEDMSLTLSVCRLGGSSFREERVPAEPDAAVSGLQF